jgi:hypothetical protein
MRKLVKTVLTVRVCLTNESTPFEICKSLQWVIWDSANPLKLLRSHCEQTEPAVIGSLGLSPAETLGSCAMRAPRIAPLRNINTLGKTMR